MTTSTVLKGALIAAITSATLPASANSDYSEYGFIGASSVYGKSVFSEKSSAQFGVEPNVFYNGQYGFVDGSLVNVAVFPWLGISGQWRFAEVADGVNDIPNGIEDREGNAELGITLGTVGARFTYLHDVSDVTDGYELQLHLGRSFETAVNDFTLTPYIEADYRDKKLSSHLYTVTTKEAATSSVNAYQSGSSWRYQAGLIGIYDISPEWIALFKAEFEHHDSESPLVQRDNGWALSVGVAYNFSDWLK